MEPCTECPTCGESFEMLSGALRRCPECGETFVVVNIVESLLWEETIGGAHG